MKVLMLSDSYPPMIGGIEKHVSLLSRELVKRKHDVTVCTIQHGHPLETETVGGVKIIRSKGLFQRIPFLYNGEQSRDVPPFQDLLITRNLRQIISKERPDIMHAHGWLLFSLLPLKKETSIPLVTSLHDYRLICPNQTLMSYGRLCSQPLTSRCLACASESYGLLKALFVSYGIKSKSAKLDSVDRFIAVSSFVKEMHSKYLGLKSEEIVRIPNFCSMDREASFSKKSDFLPEDFVLFVGVLSPYKGVNVLIEAYNQIVRERETKTKLVLVGKRMRRTSCKPSKSVFVIEDPSDDFVRQAYLQSRFVVVPSIWPDPCPTVAFEAMISRKPIIASAVGGLTDIVINGKTGLLVPPNDPIPLKMAIERLISNDGAARRMGEYSYQRVQSNFDAKVVVPKIESIYESLA